MLSILDVIYCFLLLSFFFSLAKWPYNQPPWANLEHWWSTHKCLSFCPSVFLSVGLSGMLCMMIIEEKAKTTKCNPIEPTSLDSPCCFLFFKSQIFPPDLLPVIREVLFHIVYQKTWWLNDIIPSPFCCMMPLKYS